MNKRSITVSIWTDAWFEELNAAEKLVWLHLLTHTNSNMLGFFDISIKRIASDCSLDKSTVEAALSRFATDKKAFVYDRQIWLCNFTKHQTMNSNMVKNARSTFEDIPFGTREQMKADNPKAFGTITELFGILTEPFGMVTEPLRNHSPQEEEEGEEEEKGKRKKKSVSETENIRKQVQADAIKPIQPPPAPSNVEERLAKIMAAYPLQHGTRGAMIDLQTAYVDVMKSRDKIREWFERNEPDGEIQRFVDDPPRFLYRRVKRFAELWEGQDMTYCPTPSKFFRTGRYWDPDSTYGPREKNDDIVAHHSPVQVIIPI